MHGEGSAAALQPLLVFRLFFLLSPLFFGRGGRRNTVFLSELFNFYGQLPKKDEIQLVGRFHRSEQMDFDSCADRKIKSTLFSWKQCRDELRHIEKVCSAGFWWFKATGWF